MSNDIAIVVAAYNRPDSLRRLLGSLGVADYGSFANVPLIISIDYSGNSDCKSIAEAFEWKHGTKTVLQHPHNLGLKKHILRCGDFTQQYDAVIVLEDDLFLSPVFYDYAQQAYSFYKSDEHVAGIALYHNTFNEVAYCPFEPVHDGSDVYFMQVPCSWGQLWTREQWQAFNNYLQRTSEDGSISSTLPETVQAWPDASSWKKLYYRYLSEAGKYFVYPRIGLSTNFGDAGRHLTNAQTVFQTPILLAGKTFLFSKLSDSLSIYDGFFELDGSVYNKLVDASVQVSFDLNGSKSLSSIQTKYLISNKQCHAVKKRFAVSLYPYENNVLQELPAGEKAEVYFSLGETVEFRKQVQFNRLPLDFKRVFLNDVFIRQAVREEISQTADFRLGYFLLRPLRFIKKMFR